MVHPHGFFMMLFETNILPWGSLLFRLIKNWTGGVELKDFEKKINSEGIETNIDEIKSFVNFLQLNNLIVQPLGQGVNLLSQQKNSLKKHWLLNLIHSYLFFKIPLFKPDEFLNKFISKVKNLGSKNFRNLIYFFGFIGIFLVIQQYESFAKTFMYFFTFNGLLLYLVTLIFVKCLHELGHAFVAKHFGCRVSAIGIAFLVFFPFLYTDTTDAWRLRNHKERLLINFAGILTELHLALIATFAWAVLPDGGLKSVAFFIATTSWISSLVINVSPFMRFDGYYVFADWLKAENLQPRSFALARWQVREILFGLNHSPPEELNPSRRWLFIIYAWSTWIYRFFLFIGIALLVYHFAFKVLGIILFVIEIYWFIMAPIVREMKQWFLLKKDIKFNIKTFRLLIFLITLSLLLFAPWKSSLKIPAVFTSEQYSKIYAPYPAQIKNIMVKNDDEVKKGQSIIEFYSPKLEDQINSTQTKLELIKTKLNRLSDSAGNMDQYITLQQRLISVNSELSGLLKIQDKMILKSPIDGSIKDLDNLSNGIWVNNRNELFGIVKYGTGQVKGFIKENQIDRFKLNNPAVFIPSDGTHEKINLISKSLDYSGSERFALPFVIINI